MKLEKAFSLEIKETITADEADFLYGKNSIRSKFKFACPDLKCNAQITCANLDKPKQLRKRDPYYKAVSEHSAECDIGKDIALLKTKKSILNHDLYSDSDELFADAVRLNLQPPSAIRPDGTKENEAGDGELVNTKRGTDELSGKRKHQPTKTLSSLVDAFRNNENFDVQLPGTGTIPLQELFVEVNGQEIASFDDELRIYYGKAWINDINDAANGFCVRFANDLCHKELVVRPTFFITHEQIEQYSYKKFQKSTLDALVGKQPKTVFILSETGASPNATGKYINFFLEGLAYVDYRE